MFNPPKLAALTGVLLSASAMAQTATDGVANPVAEKTTVSAEAAASPESPVQLEAVEVTSQRLTEVGIGDETGFGVLGQRSVLDTPFSVTAFTEALIRNTIAQNLTDVLTRDPSISAAVNAAGFRDAFEIRGFAVSRGTYLFDGVPGITYTDGYLGIGNIERVEVFRGTNAFNSGGAVFGGVGGTLNLVPKRASRKDASEITLGYQTSQPTLAADFSRRLGQSKSVGVRATAYYADGDGAVDGFSRRSENYALYTDWQPRDDLYLAAEVTRFRSRSNFYRDDIYLAPGVALPDTPSLDTNYSQPWAFIEESGTRLYAKAQWDFVPGWSLSAGGGQIKGDDENGYYSAFGEVTDNVGTLEQFPGRSFQPERDNEGAQVTLSGAFKTGVISNRVVIGATYAAENSSGSFVGGDSVFSNLYSPTYVAEPAAPRPAVDSDLLKQTVRTTSLLYEAAVLDGRLVGILGARDVSLVLDADFARYNDSKISPFGALYFKPTPATTVYASYTQGLQQGGTAPSSAVNGDDQLPPGVNEQVELGAKWQLGELLLTAAVFEITRPLNFLNTANVFVADGEQRHRGLELQATGNLARSLRLIGGVTYLDADVNNGNPSVAGNRPVGVPEYAAALYVEFDLPQQPRITLTAGSNYQSSQFVDLSNDPTREADGWVTFDLGARYATKLDGVPLTARFVVNNVAEAAYWEVNQSSGLLLSSPRVFRFSLTASF